MSLRNNVGLQQKIGRNLLVAEFERRPRRKKWNRKRRGVGLKDVGRHRANKYVRQGGVVGVDTTVNSDINRPFVTSSNRVSCYLNSSDTTRGISSVASRYINPRYGGKKVGFHVYDSPQLHGRYRGADHPWRSSEVRVPPLHVVNESVYPTQPSPSYSAVSGGLGQSMPGRFVCHRPSSRYIATSPTDHRCPSGDPSMYKRGDEDTYPSYGMPGGSHSQESPRHQPLLCSSVSQSIISQEKLENLRRAYKRAIARHVALQPLKVEFKKAMREWNHDRKQRCEYELFVGEDVAYDPEHPSYDASFNSKAYDPTTSLSI